MLHRRVEITPRQAFVEAFWLLHWLIWNKSELGRVLPMPADTQSFSSAEGLTTRDGEAPDHFEIAGETGKFHPADAAIKGNRIILSSPNVPKPEAIRFGWHKLATPNLTNAADLPASPFRAGKEE